MKTGEMIKKLGEVKEYYEKNCKSIKDVSTPISYFLLLKVIERLKEYWEENK